MGMEDIKMVQRKKLAVITATVYDSDIDISIKGDFGKINPRMIQKVANRINRQRRLMIKEALYKMREVERIKKEKKAKKAKEAKKTKEVKEVTVTERILDKKN